jgi:hypothetical protein
MQRDIHTRTGLGGRAATLGALIFTLPALAHAADAPTISIGAGMRTSFTSSDLTSSTKSSDFTLDSARLYINGSVTDKIKFTVNTEYTGDSSDTLILMDAIARFEVSDKVNFWAGRLLPPSDRSNLYGPYYANNWKVYIDGVQDMWPNVAVGRDNGLLYWGQFGKVKLSAGVFDVPQTFGNSKTNAFKADALYAGRAQLDLWDPEGGYYQNGTYYGEKDLLAFGAAVQNAGDFNAYSADVLIEKKLNGAGAIGFEGEYYKQKINPLGTVNDRDYDGYYVMGHYLFPQVVGIGKFQLLLKTGSAGTKPYGTTKTYDTKTTEFNINYIMKAFNARASLFYTNQKSDAPGAYAYKTYGLGLQLQM